MREDRQGKGGEHKWDVKDSGELRTIKMYCIHVQTCQRTKLISFKKRDSQTRNVKVKPSTTAMQNTESKPELQNGAGQSLKGQNPRGKMNILAKGPNIWEKNIDVYMTSVTEKLGNCKSSQTAQNKSGNKEMFPEKKENTYKRENGNIIHCS